MSRFIFLWAWCILYTASGRESEGTLLDRGHINVKPFNTIGNGAEVVITWPPNSSVLPTSFSIRCDVIVADHQSFIQVKHLDHAVRPRAPYIMGAGMCVLCKANRGSRVCAGVESASSPLGCDDIFTASLHVRGVPPGVYRRAGVSATSSHTMH